MKRALAKVLVGVFGHGGNAEVLQTLKNEGLSLGDPADLWTMTRLLMVVGELDRATKGPEMMNDSFLSVFEDRPHEMNNFRGRPIVCECFRLYVVKPSSSTTLPAALARVLHEM